MFALAMVFDLSIEILTKMLTLTRLRVHMYSGSSGCSIPVFLKTGNSFEDNTTFVWQT